MGALDGAPELPVVLDPACGCGNLLVAVGEAMVARGATWVDVLARLHGIDIDPVAVAITRGRLQERAGRTLEPAPDARLVVGDALRLVASPGGAPDVVIGNPPFGNAIEVGTAPRIPRGIATPLCPSAATTPTLGSRW